MKNDVEKSCSNSQEDLLQAMEDQVVEGESVLSWDTSVEFMEAALREALDSCSPPWDAPRDLLAYQYLKDRIIGKATAARALGLLPFIFQLGHHGIFPREHQLHLSRLIRLLDNPLSPENTLSLLGAVAGILPLTPEEQLHRDRLITLLDDYFSWTPPVPGSEKSVQSKSGSSYTWNDGSTRRELEGMERSIWDAIICLMGSVPGADCIDWSERTSITYRVADHSSAHYGDRDAKEIYTEYMLFDISWSIYGLMNTLGISSARAFKIVQEGLLLQGCSPEQIEELSFMGRAVYKDALNSEEGAIEYPLIALLEKNLDQLTWEQLFAFSALVKEYNLEWAVAAMEWDAPASAPTVDEVETVAYH